MMTSPIPSTDDIIRMAREAGLNLGPAGMGQTVWGSDTNLERFAALVAAAEREACAQMVEELNEIGHSYGLENSIRARGRT